MIALGLLPLDIQCYEGQFLWCLLKGTCKELWFRNADANKYDTSGSGVQRAPGSRGPKGLF